MGSVVIVGCGARKRPDPGPPAPARVVYTGSYFAACLATAEAITDPGRVFILSAKYGLLAPDDLITAYNLSVDQPGAITPGQLAGQAFKRDLIGQPVTALCGAAYVALIRAVWPRAAAPLAGLSIGQQLHALAVMRGEAAARL